MFAPIATRASAFSVAPIKPRQPNVEALQYLAATASLALETEEVLKDDLDRVFTPVAGAPAAGDNIELHAACGKLSGISDDDLFDMAFDQFMASDSREMFQNGEVTKISADGGTLKGVVETDKTKAAFVDLGLPGVITSQFKSLPYVYQLKRNGCPHHVADICMSTAIVAQQLGFDSAFDYVDTRGWTFSKKKGERLGLP